MTHLLKEEQPLRQQQQTDYNDNNNRPLFFERKIDEVTASLRPEYSRLLYSLTVQNALFIADYILSMKTEINLSDNHREGVIKLLCNISKYHKNKKSFKTMTRNDIISFLESFRKSKASDPLHKWIGTYNTYRMHLLRFFKWLYHPDVEPEKRPKPEVVDNIPQLKRKEHSTYKSYIDNRWRIRYR
jgi:hypothetical protein